MNVTVPIPDALAARLGAEADLPRRILEALVLEEYRAGRLSNPELCELLGLTRYEMEGFLKAHGVYEDFTLEDIQEQVTAMERLGF
jgi:predicted HTH domain antitoxin